MNYEIITVSEPMSELSIDHVIITRDDGSFESFPVDENNPRYQQFLAEQETA